MCLRSNCLLRESKFLMKTSFICHHIPQSMFKSWHYFISKAFFKWGEQWKKKKKTAVNWSEGQLSWASEHKPHQYPLSQGFQESDWNLIFGAPNFWLVRFLQPVITSNVSLGLHCYLKTLTQVLYNFPIFPAPSVLNCIGRWIFGIWGCQVSAMGRLYALVHPLWKWILEGWRGIRVVSQALPLQTVFGHSFGGCDLVYLTIMTRLQIRFFFFFFFCTSFSFSWSFLGLDLTFSQVSQWWQNLVWQQCENHLYSELFFPPHTFLTLSQE